MSDSTHPAIDGQTVVQCVTAPNQSNLISQKLPVAQPQFLTVSYNPAAHPKQISLLDANGQPIQYTLVPSNQSIPAQMPPQRQPNNITVMPIPKNIPSNANVCCICGNDAAAKCTYGISRGAPCGRLLCLSHVIELSGANGGRFPHCPEHYQHVQQQKCSIM